MYREKGRRRRLKSSVTDQHTFLLSDIETTQGAKVRYEIPAKDPQGNPRKLSQMFGVIEQDKDNLFVEDYSVSQTSLEQVRQLMRGLSCALYVCLGLTS